MTFTPASWDAQHVVNLANKPFRAQEKKVQSSHQRGPLVRRPLTRVSFTIFVLNSFREGTSFVHMLSHYFPLAAHSVMAEVGEARPYPAYISCTLSMHTLSSVFCPILIITVIQSYSCNSHQT